MQEFGALDGQSEEEIQRLRPESSDHRLVTRLGNGRQAVVRKSWIACQLQDMLDEIEPEDYLAVVLLCTGEFSDLHFGDSFSMRSIWLIMALMRFVRAHSVLASLFRL
ncbi:MAG: hypothetical protein Ct9H300mP15_24330 [Gemmatimonadota bacterium]|nr:MAG: hypothetical protein Ct9H300mP15_24330 [Gemmatimonadota bacterium]